MEHPRFAWQVLGAPPKRSAEVRRHLGTMGAASFFVAGAALAASQSHFAWQVQHSANHLQEVRGSPATIEYYGPQLFLRGHHLYNTIYTTSLTNIINTTSSTHHHLHNTIYTTPSTQHHPHSTIYTASSHTDRCSTGSTAILPLLPYSC